MTIDNLTRKRIRRAAIRVFNGQGIQAFEYGDEKWYLDRVHPFEKKYAYRLQLHAPYGENWSKVIHTDVKGALSVENITQTIDEIKAQLVLDS
jgi:hypothetical protein